MIMQDTIKNINPQVKNNMYLVPFKHTCNCVIMVYGTKLMPRSHLHVNLSKIAGRGSRNSHEQTVTATK